MNVLVYKDGKLVCTDNPIQGTGNTLDNLLMLVSEPQDGDVLKYDAANGIWVAGTGGGSFEPDITDPQDGDTLVYDASEEKWVNGSGGGSGGGSFVIHDDGTGTLDKTWKEIHDALVAGMFVAVVSSFDEGVGYNIIYQAVNIEGTYSVDSVDGANFSTDSENGYPSVVSD